MFGAIVGAVISIIIGIACIVIGVLNRKGNVSMMHSYHINNIAEENKIPFGKIVGIGMIIIGISLIVYGILFVIYELTKEDVYTIVSNVLLIVGLIFGILITLYAIKKYNKKIFG